MDLNLYDLITDENSGGSFFLVSAPVGNTVDLSNPSSVSFDLQPEGEYKIRYLVIGSPGCGNDSTDITINVNECALTWITEDNLPYLTELGEPWLTES